MAAALLTTLLLLHAGGDFTFALFGKDSQALVRQAVADPGRAAAAADTMKAGEAELQAAVKQFEPIAREFSAADAEPTAGLDALLPFVARASDQRRAVQRLALDRLLELRGNLTEEEWGKLVATVK